MTQHLDKDVPAAVIARAQVVGRELSALGDELRGDR
jgi:hypothetical protein